MQSTRVFIDKLSFALQPELYILSQWKWGACLRVWLVMFCTFPLSFLSLEAKQILLNLYLLLLGLLVLVLYGIRSLLLELHLTFRAEFHIIYQEQEEWGSPTLFNSSWVVVLLCYPPPTLAWLLHPPFSLLVWFNIFNTFLCLGPYVYSLTQRVTECMWLFANPLRIRSNRGIYLAQQLSDSRCHGRFLIVVFNNVSYPLHSLW